MGNYSGQSWNEQRFFTRLAEICSSDEGVEAARRMLKFAEDRKAEIEWKSKKYGSITPHFLIGNEPVGVFTLEEWKDSQSKFGVSGKFVVNFEHLAKPGRISISELTRLAETLRTIPGVKEQYRELEKKQFKIRPPLSLDEILARPGAVEQVQDALDILL